MIFTNYVPNWIFSCKAAKYPGFEHKKTTQSSGFFIVNSVYLVLFFFIFMFRTSTKSENEIAK